MSSDRLRELEAAAARAQEAVNNTELTRGARLGAWLALQRLNRQIEDEKRWTAGGEHVGDCDR